MIVRSITALLISVSACVAGSHPTRADDFYNGKSISLIIGGSAGGGYDTLARGIARYLDRHLPEQPTIVAKNLPGGGGITAMNYLYNNSPKDGSEFAMVANNTPFEPMMGNKNARYDAQRLNWLGTPSYEVGIVLLWHSVPVNSVEDLRSRVTTVGASGATSSPAFFTRVLNETLGTKMRAIHGYEGLTAVFLAMERGEVEGSPSVFYSALSSTRPTWIKERKAKAIVQFGPEKLKALGDVPFALDFIAKPEDKLLLEAAIAPLSLGRPLVMPPDVPESRVELMRKALMATFADPEFIAYADKAGLIVDAPRTGEQLRADIEHVYSMPPAVIERMTRLMKE